VTCPGYNTIGSVGVEDGVREGVRVGAIVVVWEDDGVGVVNGEVGESEGRTKWRLEKTSMLWKEEMKIAPTKKPR
jgi:hypothetical protein